MSAESRFGWGILQHRDFLLFLIARSFSSIAIQMQTVAVGWQIYDVTHDPLDLGLVGLSQFLPFVLLVLPAGHIADQFDRKRVTALCVILQALCAFGLLWVTLHGLTVVWPVFALMVLFGIARAFAMPTMQALVPNLVPSADLSRAISTHSIVMQVATIVGPALGGVFYLFGPKVLYTVVTGMLIIAAILLLWMRASTIVRVKEPATWQTVMLGLQFVRSKRVVLGAISLDLFAVLFGGATALLPIYASDILHVGPTGLGLLRASPGIGAALCALVLTAYPISRHMGAWMLSGVAVFGVATIIFGFSTQFPVALIALVFIGASDMVSVYIRHLLVQMETPDAIRGRVSAVNAVFIGASNELGEFESGTLASWCGAMRATVLGGVATLMVAGVWTRLFPELAKLDRLAAPRA